MVEMYDLEWRLDEIAQYASRFSRRHSGSQDDQLAWDALQHELERPKGAEARAPAPWVVATVMVCLPK